MHARQAEHGVAERSQGLGVTLVNGEVEARSAGAGMRDAADRRLMTAGASFFSDHHPYPPWQPA